jgi:hypothetical protein
MVAIMAIQAKPTKMKTKITPPGKVIYDRLKVLKWEEEKQTKDM